MNKELLEKYFSHTCTPDEAKQVMLWFNAKEGHSILKEALEKDFSKVMMGDKLPYPPDHEPDFEKMFPVVYNQKPSPFMAKAYNLHLASISRDAMLSYYKVAAAALILIATSLISLYLYEKPQKLPDMMAEIIYVTGETDQKKVTLGDGSVIHMNHHSQIKISGDPDVSKRQVQLQGEAYFQVAHNPDRIFRVVTDNAVVEVLGTEFNVRTTEYGDLHVAVTDGSVSLSNTSLKNQQEAVILEKGQNTVMFGHTGELVVENYGVANYLAWRTGRLVFEDLPLETICVQLHRLYGITCTFENPELKQIRLTSHFLKESLDITLTVIAQSLRIAFESDGETVRWSALAHYNRP